MLIATQKLEKSLQDAYRRRFSDMLRVLVWAVAVLLNLSQATLAKDNKDYRLGPHDVLSVIVMGHPEMSAEQVTINTAGKIQVPVAGEMFVAGKTISQVKKEISTTLGKILVRPTVTVMLKQARSTVVLVSVTGEVKNPGAFELRAGDSVPELLARAGGATPWAALTRVTLLRRDGTSHIVDAHSVMVEGKQNSKLTLREGDFIVVPKNSARVLVLPAVNQPGYYAIPEKNTLTIGEALALAGGPKDRAKLKEIALFRQTPAGVQRQVINVAKVYKGQLGMNQPLQNGDIVYVPEGKTSTSTWDKITRTVGNLSVFGLGF